MPPFQHPCSRDPPHGSAPTRRRLRARGCASPSGRASAVRRRPSVSPVASRTRPILVGGLSRCAVLSPPTCHGRAHPLPDACAVAVEYRAAPSLPRRHLHTTRPAPAPPPFSYRPDLWSPRLSLRLSASCAPRRARAVAPRAASCSRSPIGHHTPDINSLPSSRFRFLSKSAPRNLCPFSLPHAACVRAPAPPAVHT